MIRTARAEEIPNIYTTGDAKRDTNTAASLTRLLDVSCVKPEWCFLAESDGRTTGCIALWTRPGHDTPTDFVLLETDWERTPDIGQALLDHATTEARKLGAAALGYCLDTAGGAPEQETRKQARHELLARNGFAVTRDGRRWEWRAGDKIPAADDQLTWRTLTELGAEPFLAVLTEILADTEDSLFQADVKEMGLSGAVKEMWQDSLDMEHEEAWYELGFDADGTAAAVSLPSRNPTVAVIGFVGVAPSHRGKGYAASVVARSTKILTEAGAEQIRGDCDTANLGMVRGFERGGYSNFVNRTEYSKKLI
ncbi:hypothetical protein PWT90_06611 [Aphanocladium album]|nr:hypothetical protein PWT90_06611 [Aphanocladium album]